MTYIGIDPGQKGAWAMLDGEKVTVRPWNEEEFVETMQMLGQYGGPCRAALEHVSAMPGQGVTSMFTFGTGFGFLQGVLRACSIPYELVKPQKWKKAFSVTADKNTSIEVCKRLFPGVSLLPTERSRRDSDGMAEALLLAEYARRYF